MSSLSSGLFRAVSRSGHGFKAPAFAKPTFGADLIVALQRDSAAFRSPELSVPARSSSAATALDAGRAKQAQSPPFTRSGRVAWTLFVALAAASFALAGPQHAPTTAVATLVAAGFIWFAAVPVSALLRLRTVAAGWGWWVVGGALFILVFCDRLPGDATGARRLLEWIPGVTPHDAQFQSPTMVLIAVAVVVFIRFVVFFQLFVRLPAVEIDGARYEVDELVAPVLGYIGFSICLVTAIALIFEASLGLTIILAVTAVPAYYVGVTIRFFRLYVAVTYEIVRSVAFIAWQVALDAILFVVLRIGRAELTRRGADRQTIDEYARARRASSMDRVSTARVRRRQAFAHLAMKRRTAEGRRAPGRR